MGKRWIRIAESIGDRIVDRRLKPIELSYKLPVPKLSRPRPAARPTLQVTAIVQRIRTRLQSLDDEWYATHIKACIGLDILALIGVAGIIGVAIVIELVAYCLIDLFGFVIGILALIAIVVCTVGVVAFYFATTPREERDDLEF